MKILLLGDFSGLHKNLKEGLEILGHEIDLVSFGDGWKKIPSNIDLSSPYSSKFIRKPHILLKILNATRSFKNYDIVQLISPVIFPRFLGLNKYIIKYILKNNRKVYLVGAGASTVNSVLADFFEEEFKYPELYKETLKSNGSLWAQTSAGRKYNKWLFNRIDGYIPIMYEYAEPFRRLKYPKLCSTIPIPINIDSTKYQDNIVQDKLIIFHGLNRPGVKGTPLIEEAFKRLERNYPDDVECIIDGKMPLDKYLELIKKINVMVDQVYSVSIGINGVYSLALGKVVVGGGEPEFLEEFNLKNSPLIRIQANVDDIYCQLEKLVKNKDSIKALSYESRLFAEKTHDYKTIAQNYIDIWTKK